MQINLIQGKLIIPSQRSVFAYQRASSVGKGIPSPFSPYIFMFPHTGFYRCHVSRSVSCLRSVALVTLFLQRRSLLISLAILQFYLLSLSIHSRGFLSAVWYQDVYDVEAFLKPCLNSVFLFLV